MKRYAMILLGKVIGIEESDEKPIWGNDPEGNPVTAVECDNTVGVGMVYCEETGKFSECIPMKSLYDTQHESKLSEMEAAVYETQASAEYNTCLLELLSM